MLPERHENVLTLFENYEADADADDDDDDDDNDNDNAGSAGEIDQRKQVSEVDEDDESWHRNDKTINHLLCPIFSSIFPFSPAFSFFLFFSISFFFSFFSSFCSLFLLFSNFLKDRR